MAELPLCVDVDDAWQPGRIVNLADSGFGVRRRPQARSTVTGLAEPGERPTVVHVVGDGTNLEHCDPNPELISHRRTIVTALPLKRDARARLSQLLGARVIDVRDSCDRVDLVLTPACSPQLINALSRQFDPAEVIVVELDDWDFEIELPGPVKRSLRSGASAYVLADSIDELAARIASRSNEQSDTSDVSERAEVRQELTAAAHVDDLISAFLSEAANRSQQPQPAPPPTE